MNSEQIPDSDRLQPVVPREPAPLMKQSRPVRKQMIATLCAADFCLKSATKEGMLKAIEALSRLTDNDLEHAKLWLGKPDPVTAGLDEGSIEKIHALIESHQRVRPRLDAAVAAAKLRDAMKTLTENANLGLPPEDVAKLKAQVEN